MRVQKRSTWVRAPTAQMPGPHGFCQSCRRSRRSWLMTWRWTTSTCPLPDSPTFAQQRPSSPWVTTPPPLPRVELAASSHYREQVGGTKFGTFSSKLFNKKSDEVNATQYRCFKTIGRVFISIFRRGQVSSTFYNNVLRTLYKRKVTKWMPRGVIKVWRLNK